MGNSEILKKWSEIQTVIISHIYLLKIPGEQRFEDFMHFGPPYRTCMKVGKKLIKKVHLDFL